MTIQDIGVQYGDHGDPVWGYRIYERDDPYATDHDLHIGWSTERGTEAQASFVVMVSYNLHYKGETLESGWSAEVSKTIPASQLHPRKSGGRWWWSVSFAALGLKEALFGSDAILYGWRVNDQVDLRIRVYSNFDPSWDYYQVAQTSETASRTCFVGYIPMYELKAAYYAESNIIGVEYETTWTRTDDRFWTEDDSHLSNGNPLFARHMEGRIIEPGYLEFPSSLLTRHIAGQRVWLDIKLNASYRTKGQDFSNIQGWVTIGDRSGANTPTLDVVEEPTSENDWRLVVRTGDSGDLGHALKEVTVKIRGGKFALDQQTVAVGEDAVFWFPPLGEAVAVDAIGSTGLATGGMASVEVDAADSDGVTMLQPVSKGGTAKYAIRLGLHVKGDRIGPDITVSPDVEVYKLAGRKRPSAMYGTGGTASVSYTSELVDQPISVIREVLGTPERGDMMLRFPDGERYAITGSVSVDKADGRRRTVTVSGQVVGD